MKLGFISLMNGSPWGGSEQLWFEAAKFAKNRGDQVFSKTQDWVSWGRTTPKQITELKNIGVNVEHFKEFSKKDYLIARFKKSLFYEKKVINFLLFFDKIDLLVINQGTVYDFIAYPELLSALKKRKIKYGHKPQDLRRAKLIIF